MNKTIQYTLFDYFFDEEQFTLDEATQAVKKNAKLEVNDSSIRARIYEGIKVGLFSKVARGIYKVTSKLEDGTENTCLLINGDGRDLSMIEDNSIDGIVTDHPYDIKKSLDGGNRKFAQYERFKYTKKDFEEKLRVLKEGCFLVEILPEENSDNYEYLYEIKKIAKEIGFRYYSKVPWKKGNFVSNTGRKSKNMEDIMIFSKGKPRPLKLDAKKNINAALLSDININGKSSIELKKLLEEHKLNVNYMSGTYGMLPTHFDVQVKSSKQKIMEAEKPTELYKQIISFISKPYELLLDQFGGSGNFAIACLELNRKCIIFEKKNELFSKMKSNINNSHNCITTSIDFN